MRLSKLILLTFLFVSVMGLNSMNAQCKTWIGSGSEEEASSAHSIYRQALKSDDYKLAFENWKIAYDLAPAADGKRDYHYTDGIKIYLKQLETETDAIKKKEYITKINELYQGAIDCYASSTIVTKSCNTPEGITKKTGYLRGRQAYDMFYYMRTPHSKNLEILKEAVEKSGDATEYSVMAPFANVLVSQFEKQKISKEEVLKYYELLNSICDKNITAAGQFATYYDQAKKSMNATFAKIETQIFDCAYFVKKFKPEYEAEPNNTDKLKLVIARLKKQGCSGADDPFIATLETKWKKYVSEHNAAAQAEFNANNPGSVAKKLFDSGDYNGAVNKYKEAISTSNDNIAKAKYQKTIASILFRKLGKYGEARSAAKAAAALRPGWGAPYMLIGDMYGKSARSCGDSWNQRLAILAALDKYKYAKSVDPSVTADANKRIHTYNKSKPGKEDVFQRGMKVGQTVKVGCWIGESVKISVN